jgi:hypothetical protein
MALKNYGNGKVDTKKSLFNWNNRGFQVNVSWPAYDRILATLICIAAVIAMVRSPNAANAPPQRDDAVISQASADRLPR